MKERLALATLSVMLAAGCGELPETAMLDEESEEHLSRLAPVGDLNWLLYVASYDVSEMKLARLARKRSNAPLVVEFSDVKIARHQRSFDQATALAAQSNNLLPAQVAGIGERQFQELNHLGASLFDRRFLSLQVKLHQEAANVAAQAASEAPAGEVREWASRAWTRWHRDEVWAGHLYNQVLTGHGMGGRLSAAPVP